jgi:hypothetical protein
MNKYGKYIWSSLGPTPEDNMIRIVEMKSKI